MCGYCEENIIFDDLIYQNIMTGTPYQSFSDRDDIDNEYMPIKQIAHTLDLWPNKELKQTTIETLLLQIDHHLLGHTWINQVQSKKTAPATLHLNWQPSEDAVAILNSIGIGEGDVKNHLSGFIAHYKKNDISETTWNAIFIVYMKNKYNYSSGHSMTSRLTEDWEPSEEVFKILNHYKIDTKLIQQCKNKFITQYQNSGFKCNNLNSRFIQYVKASWALEHPISTYQISNNGTQTKKSWQHTFTDFNIDSAELFLHELFQLIKISKDTQTKVNYFNPALAYTLCAGLLCAKHKAGYPILKQWLSFYPDASHTEFMWFQRILSWAIVHYSPTKEATDLFKDTRVLLPVYATIRSNLPLKLRLMLSERPHDGFDNFPNETAIKILRSKDPIKYLLEEED